MGTKLLDFAKQTLPIAAGVCLGFLAAGFVKSYFDRAKLTPPATASEVGS